MSNIKAKEIYFPKSVLSDDANFILDHVAEGVSNYSIWISLENNDTEEQSFSFDINIYDEDNNERAEDLEIGHIEDYNKALEELEKIINENPEINFIRISDQDNTY